MIIVSQDKTEIINFDNIVRVSVSNNLSGNFLLEVHNFCDDFESVIGIYETEERAKEILQEIIEKYEHTKHKWAFENFRIYKSNKKDFTYEMPER